MIMPEAFEPCVFLDRSTRPDGYGGIETVWAEGAEFEAAFSLDTSIQARVAKAQGVQNVYSVYTRRALPMGYHTVFRRIRDGKVFRTTSDGTDKKTPPSAALDLSVVSAEEFSLTDGQTAST